MKLCVNLVWPSKIMFSMVFDAKYVFKGWQKLCFWWLKTLFWCFGLKTHVFEKHLNSFLCISFMKFLGLSSLCIIFCNFSKKLVFQNFYPLSVIFDQSKISKIFKSSFCLIRLVFNRCSTDQNWKIFSF